MIKLECSLSPHGTMFTNENETDFLCFFIKL